MIDLTKPLTTADIPARFLKAALLVDHVPQKALTYDPRVSYTLYIPKIHYNAELPPSNEAQGTSSSKLPLLVYVHGTGRDFSAIKTDLSVFADLNRCVVAAPLFPAGLDNPNDLDSYKMLKSATLRSDLAFLAMLDEIAHRWPGIETSEVFLMGFSGGGQFVHRFLYLYPERVAAVSVGAPGRVTHLDDQKDWPIGVADTEVLFNRKVDKALVGKVPIQLVIGGDDVQVHGGKEFWAWLKEAKGGQAKAGVKQEGLALPPMAQGRNDTINQLQAEWKKDGIESQLDVVPGAAHAGSGPIRACVLSFLQPLIQKTNKM